MSMILEILPEVSAYEAVAVFAAGALFGIWVSRWKERALKQSFALKEQTLTESARRDAEALERENRIKINEESLRLREQLEAQIAERRKEITAAEHRLNERESLLNRQLENLVQQETLHRTKIQEIEARTAKVQELRNELEDLRQQRRDELKKLASLDDSEIRQAYIKEVQQESQRDAEHLSHHIIDAAKNRAEEEARRIVTVAIQRYSSHHISEICTATLALHGDDIKGRIIGREGRNIRAFEAATGVTVLIDDTPNAVVLSAFDPVRREIAREAMSRLILDGRIHPTRIEEIVGKVSQEMDETIRKTGEDAILRVGLPTMHPEIVQLLGRLRFRHSFAQNVLDHSEEVASLMALLAAELRFDIIAAKRAGLLHDIGKAVSHEIEGPHAIVGAELLQRYGESPDIVNAVAAHHDDVPATGLLATLVSAADTISASRPGARSETLTAYIKRAQDLERIGHLFPGVDKCYAIQAGREIRIFVQPEQISDEQATNLARNIARKVENELQYPGQIRVTVVRETRCVEYAK